MPKISTPKRFLFVLGILIPAIVIFIYITNIIEINPSSGISSFWSPNWLMLIGCLCSFSGAYIFGIISWQIAVSLAVTTIFLGWFVIMQDWSQIGTAFHNANILYIIVSIAPIPLIYVLRVLRWEILMRPVKKLSLGTLMGATLIGYMASNVLPLRAGEFIRPAFVKMRYGASFTGTLATIVVERLLDIVGLAMMLIYVVIFWPISATTSVHNIFNTSKIALVLAIVIICTTALILILRYWPEKVKGFFLAATKLLPQSVQQRALLLIDQFVTGLTPLANLQDAALMIFYTIAGWVLDIISVYYSARVFGFCMSFSGACFVVICIILAVALPQAPGYIGTFHWAATLSALLLQMPKPAAVSFAIFVHAVGIIPVTIAGLLVLWKTGLTLRTVSEQAKNNEVVPDKD